MWVLTNVQQLNMHGLVALSINEPLSQVVLDGHDTRLLQHYITSTSLTISTDAETTTLWQDTVPRLARQHPFLMHGILACAELHLAYLYPAEERDHVLRASMHQELAMPIFRSAIANVDKDNCHAILAFSHALVIYTWASEKQDERLLLVEADRQDILPPWLYFLRGGCELFCKVWHQVETGPVWALASACGIPLVVPDSKTDLVVYLLSAIPEQTSPGAWTLEECKIYHDAAVQLGTAFSSTPPTEIFTTWDALRIWPMYISVEFYALLQRLHSGALILLAHFCILLQRVESHWYFEGRATRLLSTILRRLDRRWHHYIKWPLQEVGLSSVLA
jgi:hypothetical protein